MESKYLLQVMVFTNGIVLLGQLWPPGAVHEPYARLVNIAFLAVSLGWFLAALRAPSE